MKTITREEADTIFSENAFYHFGTDVVDFRRATELLNTDSVRKAIKSAYEREKGPGLFLNLFYDEKGLPDRLGVLTREGFRLAVSYYNAYCFTRARENQPGGIRAEGSEQE